MEYSNQEEERYFKAKEKVHEIRGFYGHLASFVLVNITLLIINLLTSPDHLWFFWPTIGWGVGVAFHAMKVFNYAPFFDKEWEERKIKEIIERENNRKKNWQ